MKIRLIATAGALALAAFLAGCGGGATSGSYDANRITSDDLASVNASDLYEVVQRLRPRWLQVRSPRGMQTETRVVVFLHRTYLGGADELRRLGLDTAEWLEYRTGSDVVGELSIPGSAHVQGAIIVHTSPPDDG